jgi:hypothetical protein
VRGVDFVLVVSGVAAAASIVISFNGYGLSSVIIFGGLSILGWLFSALGGLLGHIWVIGGLFGLLFGLLGGLVWIVAVIAWIGLMLMAYSSPKTLFVGPRWERIL